MDSAPGWTLRWRSGRERKPGAGNLHARWSATRPASGSCAGITCTAIRGVSSDTRMTEAIAATARWQSCAIVEVATRTPAIKSFFLRLSETFDYTAGQHVDVRLTAPNGYTAMRSYSIASAPSVGLLPLREDHQRQLERGRYDAARPLPRSVSMPPRPFGRGSRLR